MPARISCRACSALAFRQCLLNEFENAAAMKDRPRVRRSQLPIKRGRHRTRMPVNGGYFSSSVGGQRLARPHCNSFYALAQRFRYNTQMVQSRRRSSRLLEGQPRDYALAISDFNSRYCTRVTSPRAYRSFKISIASFRTGPPILRCTR